MSDFGRAELHDLAQTANRILSDELALHGFNVSAQDGAINGGMVRAVAEALDEAGYMVMLKRDARLMYGVPTDGKGEHVHFDSVTPEGNKIRILGDPSMSAETRDALGEVMDLFASQYGEEREPEPPAQKFDAWDAMEAEMRADLSAPAQEIAEPPHMPAPGAELPIAAEPAPKVADDHELHPTWTPEQHALYRQAADAIRAMAVHGYMPAAVTWNAERTADLPAAQTLLNRLGCKWNELAAWLGLKVQRPGYGAQSRNSRKAAPLPDTPPKAVPPLRGKLVVGPDGLAESVVGANGGETLAARNERVYGN